MRRVLFICTGNAARSQMAEALVNARRGEAWEARSAGTRPAAEVHPLAVRALEEIGVPACGLHPKPLDAVRGRPFDLVVTVCDDAASECPSWPEPAARAHLPLPDPAAAGTLDAFRTIRDHIARQLGELLDP